MDRVYNICWTAAQESAHNYGLDHAFQYSDGQSACNDPMTYRTDCGGEKFFRNKGALCGENTVRACICPGNQDSHQKLLTLFGPGTVITPPPTVSIVLPAPGAVIASGAAVQAKSYSQRGVARVELWLNNHKWAEAKGAAFGSQGQPETTYALTLPNNVPNSVIDIVTKSYDDLEEETDSATVTVTKVAPCATADTCLKGQKCEAGKCFWDPPTGAIGVSCTYNEFCIDGLCAGPDTQQICTKNCILGSTDACPMGFDCVATADTMGICLPPDSGGCCSVDHESSHAIWVHAGLGALVIGLVLRRRRRR
jgi:MYXO-CTERM domain-containing protein